MLWQICDILWVLKTDHCNISEILLTTSVFNFYSTIKPTQVQIYKMNRLSSAMNSHKTRLSFKYLGISLNMKRTQQYQ